MSPTGIVSDFYSVCLSTCISVVSTGPINVNFGVGGTFMKICRGIPNLVNRTYVSGTVHDDVTYATLLQATLIL